MIILFIIAISLSSTVAGQEKYYSDLYSAGIVELDNKNYPAALSIFEEGIALEDELINQYRLGRIACRYEMREYKKILIDIGAILEEEKNNDAEMNSVAYWYLAMYKEATNDIDGELAAYKKAIQYDPTNYALQFTIALVLIEKDRAEEGVSILDNLIASGGFHPYIFNNRATGLIKLGRLEEAKEDLDQALKLDAENPFVYRNYCDYYLLKNNKNKACESITMAITKDIEQYGLPADRIEFEALQLQCCEK